MRVVISGLVTAQDIKDAEFYAGITTTQFIGNGLWPFPQDVWVDKPGMTYPIEPKILGPAAEKARNWTLTINADAVIIKGENEHLASCARKHKLPVYHC